MAKLNPDDRPHNCTAEDWRILQALVDNGGDLKRTASATYRSLASVRMVAFQWPSVWKQT